MSETNNTTCSNCGADFHCGYQAGEKSCWCFHLPHIGLDEKAEGCVCMKCLQERIQQHATTNYDSSNRPENHDSL